MAMKSILFIGIIAAATAIAAITSGIEITNAVAQMADNATMGNMTGGNMTMGGGNATDINSTDAVGGISGIEDPFG